MRLRCNQQSHQPDSRTFDITIHFHGDVLIHLRLIEEFFRRQTVLASWTLRELASKPRPKYYEDSVQVVVYRLQLQGSVLSAEYSQQKLLENWCQQMPLWALPTLPHHLLPTASWERSHEIQLCELSIGNVVGSSIFCEHHRLGAASSVFDHSAQTLSMFLERANVGVLRLVVRYNQIRKMLVTTQDHNHVYLLLHMRAVSLVSFVDNKQLESHLASSSGELRLEDISTYQRKHDLDTFDPSFPTATEFGSCLTISLHARGATATLNNLISRVSRKVSHYGEVAYCRVERRLIHPVDRARLRAVQEAFIPLLKSFEIKYAVCALFSWSNEIIDQLFTYNRVQEVLALIRALELKSSHSLNLALEDVFTSLENGAIIAFEAALEMLFTEHYSFDGIAREMPVSGTVYVRRVFVTPTRMILRFADLHTQNRILRHFDSEYAIRVCFRDDNLDKLTFSVLNMRDKLPFLNHVVGDHIRSGITIGGRKYMYVAASSSQLRDHGVWFYALDPSGFDAASIRQWMGDFSNISNVATRMARMGQCFSSTQETVEVTPLEEVHEDDIWYQESVHPVSRKPYCFSDGCGKISRSLLEEVWGSLPHIVSQPSALQIRYRGCKGMVCLDPSIEGRQLVLRKSMVKFECNSNRKLEVIKWSAPMNMFLNRPFIAILEHHGVKIDVFLRLELEMILQIADSLVCEASALRVLTSFVKTPIPFYGLAETGWQLVQDPFFTQMLFDLLKTSLISLKEKANIAIPVNEGRNMLGVVDETGLLEYGQVFIQFTEMPYSDISQARTRIVEADVVVTKCPCLHPGDVRRLRAVDIPELHHIRDCIVFPSKGEAPHPFEMSGSDLDGDEYICIWKEDLIFRENVEPHLYDDKPLGVVHPYQRPIHEVSFLCSYIANDMIGIISNAHLAWADQSGLISEKCLALVDKASKALDFAKTGHSVDLHPNEKPEKFPDFMEKGDHKHSYQSNKALGILYRTVRQIMSVNDTQLSSGHKFSPLEVPGWQMFREDAHTAMRRYNQRLANIMDQHGIMSEGEVFSGRIGTLNTFDASRAEKASVALLVERQKTALMEETREQFFAELKNDCIVLGAHAAEDRRMLRLQKASSWFMAAYALQPLTEGAFYSFPWCIAHVLLEAKWWLRQTYPSMLTVHELSECRENILVRVIDERLGNFSLVTSHQRVRAHLTEWLGRLDRGSRIEHAHSPPTLCTTVKDSVICAECFETIYRSFADAIALPKQLTTVGEYIVNFLTFLACGKCVYPSECLRATCRRFLSSDCPLLTVEASKAYVRFAINKDPCFLGLPCDQGVHKVNNIIMDAPPEKINISEKLHRFLAADEGRQCAELLSRWTGVQHISIRFHHRHHHRGVRYSSLRPDQDNCEDASSADGDRTCCSIKVHYCGTDAQIFAMQQILRSENLQRALVEDRGDLLSRER